MQRSTHYLTMRDGVRLAINLWLPRDAAEVLPTVLHQTRYMRSVDWKWPLANRGIERFLDSSGSTRERLVGAGYAWLDVDVRGSGASRGSRPSPWWRDEVADGAEIVDWIIAQPWSNGRVGTTGVSYSGTCAEMLLVNRHPAVVASIPRFSLYDVFADIAFPGGIQLEWFTRIWSRFNRDLDDNNYHQALARMVAVNAASLAQLYRDRGRHGVARFLDLAQRPRFRPALAQLARLVTAGVTPVDREESEIAHALADHRDNFDVHAGATQMVYRDDRVSPHFPDQTIDVFSPHTYAEEINESGTAVLSVSGWLDGGYNDAAAKRFLNGAPGKSWLLLGPWDHGGRQDVSPHSPLRKTDYDHDTEMLRFFDAFVRHGRDTVELPPVRYFTMGSESWSASKQWPPASVVSERLHLGPNRSLGATAPPDAGFDTCVVDNAVGTGHRSRWRSLLGLAAPLGYGDRSRARRPGVVSYTGEPLASALTITGHPIVELGVTTDEPDGSVFVYLEDVAPSGAATYVTEGQLRLIHRAEVEQGIINPARVSRSFLRADAAPMEPGRRENLRIGLYSVSYRFARGHRIRLSIAGADGDHFAPIFADGARFSIDHGSSLEMPVERQSAS